MNQDFHIKKYPNVSYVIPAYNAEDTIRDAVTSIFKGNYQKGDEIIIVNDCSEDKTLEVIESIKKEHSFITVINNVINKGCPASRNIGISKATNSLIFNLDSDDILFQGSRFKLEQYMLDNNADVAAFGESHFFQTDPSEVTHRWVYKGGIMTLSDFLTNQKVPGGNYIYTKDSWNRVGKYWEYGKGLHEFWGFSLKQIASGSKFIVLPNSFYYHRYGRNSLFVRESVGKKEISSLMATRMIEPYLELLEPKDAEFINSFVGRKSWFDNLSKRPIRVLGESVGQGGYVRYNIPTIIKVYLSKFLRNVKKSI